MKLLIIEDEKRAREGLYNLISRHFREVHMLPPAVSGREGLKRIEEESPDIILTDIRMPDLDGLEMLSLIPRREPAPYIAVISGFSDFEYARRSIQLGVREYILKPFTADSLLQTVEKAIHSVRSSCSLRNLMLGGSGPSADSAGCQFLFRYGEGLDEEEIFSFLRKNIIRLVLPGSRLDEYSDPDRRIISFFIPSEPEEEIPLPEELIRRIRSRYPGGITGAWCCHGDSTIRKELLEQGLVMHRFYSLPPLIRADEVLSSTVPLTVFPWQQEKNLLRDLRKCDIPRAEDHFTEWFDLLTDRFHPPREVLEQVEKLVITVMNTLKETNSRGLSRAVSGKIPERLKDSGLRTETSALFRELISCFQTDAAIPETNSPVVQKVLQYINTRLHEPITLEETAETVQISPEHLSRLFKEETGRGFNSYVNSRKIDRAREMLLRENRSIHCIAEELGYSSSRYFARVFKKVTAMTPREFRELRQD